jgi:hypothetical protein
MNLHEDIQRIKKVMGINESASLSLKRRLSDISKSFASVIPWISPHSTYGFEHFIDTLAFSTTRQFIDGLGIDDNNKRIKLRDELRPFIRQYIVDNHLEEIEDTYENA